MGDLKEQINNLKFETVFYKLGIKTFRKGIGILGIYDGKNKTDGRVLDVNQNLVNDFSGKRAKGDVISFLSHYLKLDFKEVLKYGEDNFGLIQLNNNQIGKVYTHKSKPKVDNPTIDIKKKFNELSQCSQNQIDYINSRGIDYEKVKDVIRNNNGISCMIHNELGQAISINTRSLDEKRFYILAGTQSKGVYMGDIDKESKKIYVVEGMFDFLSLRQYTKNVIGLKSATDGYDVVRAFEKKGYELIIIPDNDEAGEKILESISDIKYSVFRLSKYDVKDINEFLVKSEFGKGIIEVIEDEKIIGGYQEEFEIVNYKETLQDGLSELEDTNPNDSIQWGFDALDNKIGYMLPGQLILVGGTTGTGKSTFVGEIAKNVSKQGNNVLKFTLEDRLEDNKKRDIYNQINKDRVKRGFKRYPYNDFMSNDISSDTLIQEKQSAIKILENENRNIFEIKRQSEKQIDVDNLDTIIKKGVDMGCKLIVLDHLQEFKVEGDKERQDLKIEEIMYRIKNFTRKYRIVIVLIAHFKKVSGIPDENSFKDSISITQVSNKVLILHRDKLEPNGLTDLYVYKNRENSSGTGKIELNFDFHELKYTNTKSNKQLEKEKKFNF